ncbi:hypothetical protein C8J57DRAFT_1067514, partial [Mycena rebaudengoi]
FILSDHCLAVEVLRHGYRWYEFPHGYRRHDIPRNWRLCRFCQMDIEDEVHATLVCTSNPRLTPLRADFLRAIFDLHPPLRALALSLSAEEFLRHIVLERRIVSRVARFVYDVLQIFDAKEVWVPPREFVLNGN